MQKTDPMISRTAPPLHALVLAGRREGEIDPLASVENAPHKALLIAGGKPLILRVIEALKNSGRIGSIKIAAPEDIRADLSRALAGLDGWSFTDTQSSPAQTVLAAIAGGPDDESLLVTTCDHALLTAQMVNEFLGRAGDADAAAACVSKTTYEARFPGSQRTFIRLKDFAFSGANLFIFAGSRARGLAEFWRRLEAKRKNPAAMAREIGVLTAIAYLTGQMSLAGFEKTIRKRTGAKARLISLSAPEAAIDVDKPADLALVREILAAEHKTPPR